MLLPKSGAWSFFNTGGKKQCNSIFMPRILRIINRFNLGGPTYNVAYLTKYLAPEFETLLVGGEKDESEDSSEHILHNLGLEPLIIPEMKREINFREDYIAYQKLKKIINDFKPDIVHTHAAKAGALGRLAAASCKVPIIVHTFHGHVFHSYFGKLKTGFYKETERFMAKKSNCIVAISEKQKHEIATIHHICEPEKIKVIPLGFDLQKFQENLQEKRKAFRTQYNIEDDEIAIGIIGRLVPIKNHSLFLQAIKYINENSTKKIKTFIVGDGEERENIENTARCLKIDFENNTALNKKTLLIFTSWRKDIDVVMAGLDIVALTSFNEGTPVSLIEAQAANKPIVTTNTGGIENIVIPGETALLSSVEDADAFYKNLLLLVDNASLRARMSQKGWEHVKEKFHYTRLIQDMQNLYHQLLKVH